MEWINASDRLPEFDAPVLVFVTDEYRGSANIEVAYRYEAEDEGEDGNNQRPFKWSAQSGPMDWDGQDVTHWMPLPAAPQEATPE